MKKLLLVLIIVVALLLSSCDKNYADNDKALHNKITFIHGENGHKTLIYNGISYYFDKYALLDAWEDGWSGEKDDIKDDIMITWTGAWMGPHLMYTVEYYSYTQDSPLFIYSSIGEVYFCETYDYKFDTFVVEGTNAKFVLSDAIRVDETFGSLCGSNTSVILRSETYPRVFSDLDIVSIEGTWYARTRRCYCYEITDEFKQLLIENKIIEN